MSETQSTLFNRRARYVCIAGAFLFLLIVFFLLGSSGVRPEVVIVKVVPVEESSSRGISSAVIAFDSESFYRTIIDNNLFRPLGWRPPRPIEPYRLIGTILPRAANTPPKAILQTTTGNTTHIVSLGEQIDASTRLVSIESKTVRLSTNGQQRTLKLPSGF